MAFEELSNQSITTFSPSPNFEHLNNSLRDTETRAINNIVNGPKTATSPTLTLPVPSLVADAALVTTLVAGISTGILLELPEHSLPPLEQFRSLVAGAILADQPQHYQNEISANISREIFRAPELKTEAEKEKHNTPCSRLRNTKLREKAHLLNQSWQQCLAPELS